MINLLPGRFIRPVAIRRWLQCFLDIPLITSSFISHNSQRLCPLSFFSPIRAFLSIFLSPDRHVQLTFALISLEIITKGICIILYFLELHEKLVFSLFACIFYGCAFHQTSNFCDNNIPTFSHDCHHPFQSK